MMQEIVVALIGVAVAVIVINKIYGFFFSEKEQKGSCGCSGCGCSTAKKNKIVG